MAEKYTESQKKASLKYAKKLKRVPLDLRKEDLIAEVLTIGDGIILVKSITAPIKKLSIAAKSQGKSINGFIKEAIQEKILRDKK